MMSIKLKSILPDFNPEEYKVYFARKTNGEETRDFVSFL